jgi:transcription elongation factor SPT6
MSMRDLINEDVEVDDEENDDSFDEETGEVRSRKEPLNGHIDDSSEEEDDDDDEEAARAVGLPSEWMFALRPNC